jgi:hypothetical protein
VTAIDPLAQLGLPASPGTPVSEVVTEEKHEKA